MKNKEVVQIFIHLRGGKGTFDKLRVAENREEPSN